MLQSRFTLQRKSMRRSKSNSNMNTVVGLVAAILVVNVLIFFVVTRKKDKSEEESAAVASAQERPQAQLGAAAAGGTSPELEDLKNENEEPGTQERPLEFNEPEEVIETDTPDKQADEVVETAALPDNSKQSNKRSRAGNDRNERNARGNNKMVETVVVAPPVPKVEPQSAKTNITTVPSGATVSLDGIFIGKSPIIGLSIASGNHSVAVSYSGYEPQVSRLKVGHGGVEKLKIRLEKKIVMPKTVAVAPVAPTLVIKKSTRGAPTPRVGKSTMGSESRGRSLLAGKCNSCHSKEGAKRVSTKKYTSSQWVRFFASGKHDRYQRLGGKIASGQLADVKAYVISKAADAARNQGAGIR